MIKIDFIKNKGVIFGLDLKRLTFRLGHIPNGSYELIVRKVTPRWHPSNEQLLKTWFNCLSQATGLSAEDVDMYYRILLLKGRYIRINPDGNLSVLLPGRPSDLSDEQWAEYLNGIQADALGTVGVKLPFPDDDDWERFYADYK